MIVVQIGTNNGADEFNAMCMLLRPTKIILVEPLEHLHLHILENYKSLKGVVLENVAITAVEKRKVFLVIPKGRPEMFGDGNFSLLPMDDWGTSFHVKRAQGITFNQLCEKHNITHINFLQIDTEGYDAEIIKSIDFSKVAIDTIRYEKWKFSPDCFTRHGEKGKQYGTAGMDYVANLLKEQGYALEEDVMDVIATKN